MNQLIHSGATATMSSREIAELTGKEHKNVIRDIRNMLEDLQRHGSDLSHAREEVDQRGYTAAFHLDRELTDTLLTGYSAHLRRKVIARWHELEGMVSKPSFHVPTTFTEALRLALEQAEKLEQQQALIEQQKPAVEFVDRYVTVATGEKGFREVCKILSANEARFREFLIGQRIMYRLDGRLMAHQNHIDAGRFRVVTGINQENEHAYTSVKMTPKGVEWVAGEWAKYQLRQQSDPVA